MFYFSMITTIKRLLSTFYQLKINDSVHFMLKLHQQQMIGYFSELHDTIMEFKLTLPEIISQLWQAWHGWLSNVLMSNNRHATSRQSYQLNANQLIFFFFPIRSFQMKFYSLKCQHQSNYEWRQISNFKFKLTQIVPVLK